MKTQLRTYGLTTLLLSLSLMNTAHAELKPSFGNDNRIQYFNYTPNDVFVINTQVGRSSLIQFEDGEVIHDDGGLGMGEAQAWSLGVKANNIFFKPKQPMPDTNMIVVTNKRTYAFELKTADSNITYVARFKYPETPLKDLNVSDQAKLPQQLYIRATDNEKGEKVFIDSRINVHYFKRGDKSIAPTNVWDDNLFTYLKYDNADDLPTVYKVLEDGSETLVNTHTKENVLVVHEVTPTLRLRLGRSVVDLQNGNKQPTTFNHKGTSDDHLLRTVK